MPPKISGSSISCWRSSDIIVFWHDVYPPPAFGLKFTADGYIFVFCHHIASRLEANMLEAIASRLEVP